MTEKVNATFFCSVSLFHFFASAAVFLLWNTCARAVCVRSEIRLGMHTHNKSGGALLCSKSSMKVGEKEREGIYQSKQQQQQQLPNIRLSVFNLFCTVLGLLSPAVRQAVRQSFRQRITVNHHQIRSTCYQQCSQSAFVCGSCAL